MTLNDKARAEINTILNECWPEEIPQAQDDTSFMYVVLCLAALIAGSALFGVACAFLAHLIYY